MKLLALFLSLFLASPLFAQPFQQGPGQPPPGNQAVGNQPGNQPVIQGQPAPGEGQPQQPTNAEAAKDKSARPVGAYPIVKFHRGSHPKYDIKSWYINLFLFIPFFLIFLCWVYSTSWVGKDTSNLRYRPDFWNSLVMLCGTGGFLLFFICPNYSLGVLLSLTGYAAPFGTYVYSRNQRVPESAQVLTPRHIQEVAISLLARIGIHIGGRDIRDKAIGPPIRFIGKSKSGDEDRTRQVEGSRGYRTAKELVYDAIMRRATDIHLEPTPDEMHARYRIDGVLYPTEPMDRTVGEAVVNVFKVLGAMDITEKRKAQDGSFRAETEGREIDFRAATQGTREGEKMSLRILDQANSVAGMVDLGMRKQMQDQIREIINQPHGMFICCGPTGAGKSTTLYAALQEIDSSENNIITIEDPIEYKMAGCTQIEINTKGGQTFATSLRSVLRQDPDVVLIGEMRDQDTAKIACQAANTGHMVFTTVHSNDAISAIFRILDLDVEPFMLASSVSGVLGQRLARRLCDQCKVEYKPSPELLKKLNLPVERIDKFWQPPEGENHCPNCGGLGYRGRIGVFELLLLNDRLKDMIRETPDIAQIRAEARKSGMLYMKEEGIRLVVKGVTSVEELNRVVK